LLRQRAFQGGGRTALAALWLGLACAAAGAMPAAAAWQGGEEGDDGSANRSEEVFAAVDPYTKGQPEVLAKLGYRPYGVFQVLPGRSTEDLTRDLGGISVIWIETAHFKLGSTLATYKLKPDSIEKDHLESEFKRLRTRHAGFKPPSKVLDPWLRAHLFAQRLEDLYARFLAETGFQEGDFPAESARPAALGAAPAMGIGPHLGQPQKFFVFLAAKRSTLGRLTQLAFKNQQDLGLRHWVEGGGMFFGCSAEGLKDSTEGLDIAIHAYLANGVTHTFVEGLCDSSFAAPLWLVEGMSHWFGRQVDPRWAPYGGGIENTERKETHYEWGPRVRALIDQEACLSWEQMMALEDFSKIPSREHMVLWSRADYLLSRKPEQVRAYLLEVIAGGRPDPEKTTPEQRTQILIERQRRAQQVALGLDAAGLEREWAKWARSNYPRK
jgi:hypothetical protein